MDLRIKEVIKEKGMTITELAETYIREYWMYIA